MNPHVYIKSVFACKLFFADSARDNFGVHFCYMLNQVMLACQAFATMFTFQKLPSLVHRFDMLSHVTLDRKPLSAHFALVVLDPYVLQLDVPFEGAPLGEGAATLVALVPLLTSVGQLVLLKVVLKGKAFRTNVTFKLPHSGVSKKMPF